MNNKFDNAVVWAEDHLGFSYAKGQIAMKEVSVTFYIGVEAGLPDEELTELLTSIELAIDGEVHANDGFASTSYDIAVKDAK